MRDLGLIFALLVAVGSISYLQQGPGAAGTNAAAHAAATAAPRPTAEPAICAMDAPCVANEYLGTAAAVDAVWNARCREMRHLVALIPDPVEAHIGWQFDPMVEAIQRAAEANGYSLDRFALPWDKDAKAAKCAPKGSAGDTAACGAPDVQDALPGVLLFRNARLPSAVPLVVYLVGETPTAGVHKRALEAALTRVAACSDEPLAILGPTFSGSMRSLAIALGEWWTAHAEWQARNLKWRKDHMPADGLASPVHLVSGTTTSPPLTEFDRLGTDDAGVPLASFTATVLPDSYAFAHLVGEYLHGELGVPLRDIALLVEANSGYGQALQAIGRGVAATSTREARAKRSENMLTLTFPMHIAAARGAMDQVRQPATTDSSVPGVARPDLALSLADTQPPLDLPPQTHPEMTLPATEFALTNLLATISRNDIRYVGLFASDARDKLFLAKQVRKYCPDVRLFTFESDLLYAHPDQRQAMVGSLVASTYPLFNRTQAWTTLPEAPRLQFVSSASQGVYNAALALLEFNAEWLMTDYAAPPRWARSRPHAGGVMQAPLLWISAVGNGGLWPLRAYIPKESELRPADPAQMSDHDVDLHHVWSRLGPAFLPDEQPERGSARTAVLVWAILTAFCLLRALQYFLANGLGGATGPLAPLKRLASEVYRLRAPGRGERLAYLLFAFATLAVAYGVWSRPFFIKPNAIPAHAGRPLIAFTLAVLVGVLIDAIAHPLSSSRIAWMRHLRRAQRAAVLLLPFVCAVIAPRLRLPAYLHADTASHDMLSYERLTSLESQLSPLIPALLVAAAWYLWGEAQLRRMALMDQAPPSPARHDRTRGAGLAAAARGARTVIASPWRDRVVLGAMLLWTIPCVLIALSFVPTFEGVFFDRAFESAFFLASVAVVALFAQALALWWQIRRLLDRLAAHPLASALGRLPGRMSEQIRASLYAYTPTLVDLELATDALRRLATGLGTVQGPLSTQLGVSVRRMQLVAASLTARRGRAHAELSLAVDADRGREAHLHARRARTQLDIAARVLVGVILSRAWRGGAAAATDAPGTWLKEAEDFVANQSLAHLGYLFLHIRNLLAAATGGVLLLLLAIPSYPFQPQRLLNLFIWVLVLGVVAGVFVSILQMNRSEVLSKLSGTAPHELSFDRTLLSPMLKYGALPLFSLVATQFPGVGDTLFAWLDPLLRAMK